MRRRPLIAATALAGALALLTGCAGSSGGSASSSTTGAAATSAAASPSGPAFTDKAGDFPEVTSSFGAKPTLAFPKNAPSPELRTKVLKDGDGPVVANGDLLAVDYLGEIWGGKVFDNSYDKGQPFSFVVGKGQVIKGWDTALVGQHVGSRVVLSIPPAQGYGAEGNAQAGIKGTDTLVFVTDIIGSYGAKAAGDPSAEDQHASVPGITVSGAPGQQPTLTIAPKTTPPTEPKVTVLAKGHGAPVAPGTIVVQYVAATWDGKPADSTWKNGAPVGAPVAQEGQQQAGAFDGLINIPVGSRVLITLPASQGSDPTTASVAAVVDIVAELHPASASAGAN